MAITEWIKEQLRFILKHSSAGNKAALTISGHIWHIFEYVKQIKSHIACAFLAYDDFRHLCIKSCTLAIRVHSTLDNGNICQFSGGSHHNYRERAAAGGLHADWALCGLWRAFPMTAHVTSKANLCRAANVVGCSLHFKEHGQK